MTGRTIEVAGDDEPIGPLVLEEAWNFAHSLPPKLSAPSIVPEPTGEIGLEWTDDSGRVFVISFAGTGELSYAGLLGGGERICGVVQYIESVPQKLLDMLLEHFSRSLLPSGLAGGGAPPHPGCDWPEKQAS